MPAQDIEVEIGIGIEAGSGFGSASLHGRQRLGKAGGVASKKSLTQFCLPGEVVVEGRLRDLQLGGNVGIAEPVEATDLDETLGHVEDLGSRVTPLDLGRVYR